MISWVCSSHVTGNSTFLYQDASLNLSFVLFFLEMPRIDVRKVASWSSEFAGSVDVEFNFSRREENDGAAASPLCNGLSNETRR